eukprot:scaffold3405_cov167-Amphora_coffeaeformis.AAC.2
MKPLSFFLLALHTVKTRAFLATTTTAPHDGIVSESFDFSSTEAWEDYYKFQDSNAVKEWHSSVPMKTLASLVPPDADSVVMVGCGSSLLPEYIQKDRPRARLILQDSSQTCLQMLHQRYGSSMSYIRGDATRLSESLDDTVDVIYDKGLMDAIFCNEGWNKPIRLLLQESSKVLNEGGMYILVSYHLPQSTKEFLEDVGSKNHLEWTFDLPASNNRVGVSYATKRTRRLVTP